MTKEHLQYYTSSLWAKIKSLFVSKEEAINGILLEQSWKVVDTVNANNIITLPSLDTFDELCIEMYNSDGTIVHQTSIRADSLLFEGLNTEYREILLDGIHDAQSYVTYNIADNTITPSYYEGVIIDETSTVTTVVYIKGTEIRSTASAKIITYDGTESGSKTDNVQDAIDEDKNDLKNLKNILGVTGKNLLVYPYYNTTETRLGIKWIDTGDGTVIASGKSTQPVSFSVHARTDNPMFLQAGTYIFSGCPEGGSDETYNMSVAITDEETGDAIGIAHDYGNGAIFTLEKDTYIAVSIGIRKANVVVENLTFKPMIRDARIEDDSFEPYQGVTVSEELSLLKNTLGCTHKNLLNHGLISQTKNGIEFIVNTDGSVRVVGTASEDTYIGSEELIFEENVDYILSGCPEGGSDTTYRHYLVYDPIFYTDYGNGLKFTNTQKILYYVIYVSAGTTVDVVFYPMVRKANIKDNTYEPYQGDAISEDLAMIKSAIGFTKKNLLEVTKQNSSANGVTFTVNDDKSITCNGTATTQFSVNINNGTLKLKKGKYILSGMPKIDGAYMYIKINDVNYTDYGEGVEFTVTEEITTNILLVIDNGVTVNHKVYPMIRYANISDSTYEQYQCDLKTQVGDIRYKYLSTDNTSYNNKPWEVIRESWSKFDRMAVYSGTIFCASRFCYLGFRYTNALYGAFIVFSYSQNKLYHVIQSNGKWSYSVITSTYTEF